MENGIYHIEGVWMCGCWLLQLHRVLADCERQKLEQERRHSRHVQQLVGDCSRRIDRMERDCASHISTSVWLGGEVDK